MTRKGRRLVEDFLLPSLNDGRYGDLLKWVDQLKGHFSIRWSHKNAAKWSLEDTLVFQDWDRLKGRFKPEQKGYYMQAKQRFRAALYKLSTVEKLSTLDKHVKHYRLCLNANRRADIMNRKMQKLMIQKGSNQSSIPTPVICKNTLGKGTELVGRDYFDESCSNSSSSSSESPYSIKSEDCDQVQDSINFEDKDYRDYQFAIKRQRKQSSPYHYQPEEIKMEKPDPESCVLRESPQVNIVRKAPHVLSQVVPVYNKSSPLQAVENSTKSSEENSPVQAAAAASVLQKPATENTHLRVESPSIFYVPTYNTPQEIEIAKYLAEVQAERKKNYEGALNLSVKCESPLLCR